MAIINDTNYNDNNTTNGSPYVFRPSLTGTSGNDTITTGFGYDIVDGKGGTDVLVVDYSQSTAPWGVSYSNYYPSNGSGVLGIKGHNRVSYSGIEQFNLTGTILDSELGCKA